MPSPRIVLGNFMHWEKTLFISFSVWILGLHPLSSSLRIGERPLYLLTCFHLSPSSCYYGDFLLLFYCAGRLLFHFLLACRSGQGELPKPTRPGIDLWAGWWECESYEKNFYCDSSLCELEVSNILTDADSTWYPSLSESALTSFSFLYFTWFKST